MQSYDWKHQVPSYDGKDFNEASIDLQRKIKQDPFWIIYMASTKIQEIFIVMAMKDRCWNIIWKIHYGQYRFAHNNSAGSLWFNYIFNGLDNTSGDKLQLKKKKNTGWYRFIPPLLTICRNQCWDTIEKLLGLGTVFDDRCRDMFELMLVPVTLLNMKFGNFFDTIIGTLLALSSTLSSALGFFGKISALWSAVFSALFSALPLAQRYVSRTPPLRCRG